MIYLKEEIFLFILLVTKAIIVNSFNFRYNFDYGIVFNFEVMLIDDKGNLYWTFINSRELC